MFKTIFARFGNIKAGKFVDDETGESLNDVAKVLSKFNIQLYDAQGNMKNVGDILDTLGNKWDSLTEVEQNALATAIAGTRQRENFIVLMENYSRATDLATKSMESAGIAEEKFGAYTEGVEAKVNKLQATFEEFSQDLLNSDLIGMFLDLGQGILKSFNSPMTQAILKATAFFVIFKTGQKIFGLFKKKLGSTNEVLWDYIIALIAGKTHTEALEFASEGLSKALNKVNIGISIASAAISIAITMWQSYKRAQEEALENAKESISKTIEEQKTLNELKEKYIQISNEETQDKETRNQIAQIQEDIVDLVGDQAEGLDLVNGKLDEELEKLENISFEKAQEELSTLEGKLETLQQGLGKNLFDWSEGWDIFGIKGQGAALVEAVHKAVAEGTLDADIIKNANYNSTMYYSAKDMELEDAEELLEIYKQIKDAIDPHIDNQAWNSADKVVTELTERIKDYKTALNSFNQTKATAIVGKHLSEISIDSAEKLEDYIGSLEKAGHSEELLAEITEILIKKFPEFAEELGLVKTKTNDTDSSTNQYIESLEEIQKQLDKAKNAYDALVSALDEYNNSGYISYDTYNDLLDVGEGYISVLFDENGAIINNTEAIANLIGIKLQQKAVEQALVYLQTVATTGMSAYTDSINEQIGATQVLTQAQLQQARIALLQITDLKERQAAAERFVAIVNSVNNVSLGSSKATNSNSEAKKKAKEIQDQYNSALEYAKTVLDEEIEKLEEEKEAIEKRNEVLQDELDIYDKALAYINKYISGKIDALQKEKQALQEKNDEQEREIELEELRNNINKNHQRTMRTYSEDQGWTWVVDPEDIKETEDAIKEYNKKVAEYEKEDEIAKIEEQIEAWEEYLAKWEEVPDVYEEMEAKIAFESLSAYVTEKDLLNKRTNAVDKFKKSYVKKQKEISRNTTEEVDKQIKKLQDIKEKWDSIPSDYETASDKLNAEMLFGKDAREKILSGEAEAIGNFAKAYAIAMKNAEDAAKAGASNISSALGGISVPKIDIKDLLGDGLQETEMSIGGGRVKPQVIKGATGDFLYNPMTKRYYHIENTVLNPKTGVYTIKEGTPYYTATYASGTLSAKAGLANVDEKGNELIVPKQGRYRMMEYGDTVVPHNLSQRLFDVATNPLKFIANAINSIKSPILNEFGGNNNITTISIENITMPQSVNNADRFVKELQLIAANR